MILSIHIKNGFRHTDSKFDFKKGLTSITGQNESGKSLILEFIRFALWGTAALRGSAGDYKKLEVTLEFAVKGVIYTVYRGKGTAKLKNDKDDVIATGTTPVNGAIRTLFGYDMMVFDVANSCNQGAIELLGQMKPGDRKKMVDQTIGLQFIDGIIEWATTEATAARRAADALALAVANIPQPPTDPGLVRPVEVVLPDNFRDPSILRGELAKLQGLKSERDRLAGAVGQPIPAPSEVEPCTVSETEAQLLEYGKLRERIEGRIRAANAELSRIVPPSHTEDELNQMESDIKAHGLWCQKKALLDKGSLTCPSCNHSWPIMADGLASLKDVVEVPAPATGVTLTSIEQGRRVLAQQARREPLEKELADATAELAACPDRSSDLRTRREYDSAVRTYERLLANHQQMVSSQQSQRVRLAEIDASNPNIDAAIESLLKDIEANARLQSARAASVEAIQTYERQVTYFESQKKQYEEQLKKHGELVAKHESEKEVAEGMVLGRDALKDLKVNIKKFLVPSLNSVASRLISKMTGGKRSSIVVDEDFNIQVDGQELITLSGSGKAVANLAIRLGLGQVLTNKVFPVFMADEIDESMDAERSGLTAECLTELAKELDQVILISHKKPSADHYIEL